MKVIISWIIFPFSFLLPRSKKIWIFSGWHKTEDREIFADNSKYLFLYLANNKSKYDISKVIWITSDNTLKSKLQRLGYECYLRNSLMGIWYALRAGYTVSDSYLPIENWKYTGRSKIINLWHGIAIKKFGFQIENYPLSSKIKSKVLFPGHFAKLHALLVTSNYQTEISKEAFDLDEDKIVMGEYPRNIALKQNESELENGSLVDVDTELLDILKSQKYSQHIMYAPTFRRGENKLKLNKVLDLSQMSTWLKKQNCLLVISLHPKDYKEVKNKQFENIYFLESSDPYPLYKYIDVMISDYSSVPMDFLLLDKPIIFYAYDLKQYSDNPGLNIDYEKDTPGEKVYNFENLIPTIEKCIENDTWSTERQKSKEKYHEHNDTNYSEKIIELILKN